MNQYKIGFAGLSHLGIVSGISASSKGFNIVGFDSRKDLCGDLSEGKLPISEPSLDNLLRENRERLTFSDDPQKLNECDLVYFSLDVPTDKNSQSDLSNLKKLVRKVLPHVKKSSTIVVLSQVNPGFTRQLSCELNEIISERDIKLYYQVETLIFGQAVERAVHPERYIVGCANPEHELPKVYQALLKAHDCPILKMRYESAELAKISINMFLAAQLSTSNTLAEICEKIGADWSEIIPTLQLDKRIGPNAYLTPGLGIAGGNIERDIVSVGNLAAGYGAEDCIPKAYLRMSRYRCDWALRAIYSQVLSKKEKPTIAVWGLAYKPNTNSVKNSPSIALLKSLRGISVRLYDPKAVLEEKLSNVAQVSSAIEACKGADALIIMTAWDEFSSISPVSAKEVLSQAVVVDPWAIWKKQDLSSKGFNYVTLGSSTK